jgi:hypothetical protein
LHIIQELSVTRIEIVGLVGLRNSWGARIVSQRAILELDFSASKREVCNKRATRLRSERPLDFTVGRNHGDNGNLLCF